MFAHAIVGAERGSELLALARQVAHAELRLTACSERANDSREYCTASREIQSRFIGSGSRRLCAIQSSVEELGQRL